MDLEAAKNAKLRELCALDTDLRNGMRLQFAQEGLRKVRVQLEFCTDPDERVTLVNEQTRLLEEEKAGRAEVREWKRDKKRIEEDWRTICQMYSEAGLVPTNPLAKALIEGE